MARKVRKMSNYRRAAGEADSRKILVAGLQQEYDDEQLKKLCQQFGFVEYANVAMDPTSGRSRY